MIYRNSKIPSTTHCGVPGRRTIHEHTACVYNASPTTTVCNLQTVCQLSYDNACIPVLGSLLVSSILSLYPRLSLPSTLLVKFRYCKPNDSFLLFWYTVSWWLRPSSFLSYFCFDVRLGVGGTEGRVSQVSRIWYGTTHMHRWPLVSYASEKVS